MSNVSQKPYCTSDQTIVFSCLIHQNIRDVDSGSSGQEILKIKMAEWSDLMTCYKVWSPLQQLDLQCDDR